MKIGNKPQETRIPEWVVMTNKDNKNDLCIRTNDIYMIDGNKVYHTHGYFEVTTEESLDKLKKLIGI